MNVQAAEALGAEPFISPGGHARDGSPEELRKAHQTDERKRMRALLGTERGRAAYARRKATVEPVIGQIRTRGVRQMSFRGMLKNRLEWVFICATHNLLKLWRRRRTLALGPVAA